MQILRKRVGHRPYKAITATYIDHVTATQTCNSYLDPVTATYIIDHVTAT